MPKMNLANALNWFNNRPRAACGVGCIVSFGRVDHQVVRDGLQALARVDYRAGLHPVTQESDGSGIRFFGTPPDFYNHKIKQGKFESPNGHTLMNVSLSPQQFIVGQYFLPPDKISQAKMLIEDSVARSGLVLLGWRNIDNSVNLDVLSRRAREKKPGLWQALLVTPFDPHAQIPLSLAMHVVINEKTAWQAALNIYHAARERGLAIDVVSHSAESVVYKGMIPPKHMRDFYLDLTNKDLMASAALYHGRFATNTDPQWRNAQPCVFFGMHNGEFNSAPTNARDMNSELQLKQFAGIYPDQSLSDSMQLDADVTNQMLMKNLSFPEAVIRLLPPKATAECSSEVHSMLNVFARERTPYNGPAFWVGGSGGYVIATLDHMGLRPSNWALIETDDGQQQFHAASDDYLTPGLGGYKVLQNGHLEPGGMVMVTPTFDILHTHQVLKLVHDVHAKRNPQTFQQQLDTLRGVPHTADIAHQPQPARSDIALNRHLYSAGWDHEAEDGVRHMAIHGLERLAAMGDDTNPLHTERVPAHVSYFFHQLFAQVSSPSLDSVKERDRFSLLISLGPLVGAVDNPKQLDLPSPIMAPSGLDTLMSHASLRPHELDLSFTIPTDCSLADFKRLFNQAVQKLTRDAEQWVVRNAAGVVILSDRHANATRGFIPDLIAIAAVRQHLEQTCLIRRVSLVVDSCQISGPHQAVLLLALGAKAVYPRGAYEKIDHLFAEKSAQKLLNYQTALNNCLLKTMGKVGITDVNNYINGHLVAALGLDLSSNTPSNSDEPSLAAMFKGLYSPLKGYSLAHLATTIFHRHQDAYNEGHDLVLLPRSGFYMPEKEGMDHGYSPAVVNAFTDWLKAEDLRARTWQMHVILERKGFPGFISDSSRYSPSHGFLDPRKKDAGPSEGMYPSDYLETMHPGSDFRQMLDTIEKHAHSHPTTLRDYFCIHHDTTSLPKRVTALDTQASIRARLFSGSMSQGALTVDAHETLTRGMNAIGAMSASGEGGEAWDALGLNALSTRSKQIASGRFGVSAKQLVYAQEIEIKVAQGAKPGEGGELPGEKVSVRFAAQRGGLPGLKFISPPPHHDVYSIEDLEQLIHDIKSVAPGAKVAVKLVASQGIDTIAVGVVKAGADVINIAGNSGGTAAAQQSSIKHTGMPAELALVDINRALTQAGLRDLVQLRVSGGFKTANDVLIAAIFGADLFEFGTTAMLTLGCKMQRTCNHSCQPGVATDGHLFKGNQLNTERYFVNLAAAIQESLIKLGVEQLSHLRGRVDLLHRSTATLDDCFDLSMLLQKNQSPSWLNEHAVDKARRALTETKLIRAVDDQLVERIEREFAVNPTANIVQSSIMLDTTVRSFGARLAGRFVNHLEKYPKAQIELHTHGASGQSIGFVMPRGVSITHEGTVLDGCVKSMTGGKFVLKKPRESEQSRGDCFTIAGNAMAYGASGGRIFVNGIVGHRLGVLLKGAEIVVEGAGDFAFEYMTSGTGMIIGRVGPGLCNSAMGGIVFVHDPNNSLVHADAVRTATSAEQPGYAAAIHELLAAHAAETGSIKAQEILATFDSHHFKILIPRSLDLINTPQTLIDVLKTYKLRQSSLTCGMQAWLLQRINMVFQPEALPNLSLEEKLDLRLCMQHKPIKALFDERVLKRLLERRVALQPQVIAREPTTTAPLHASTLDERLSTIAGGLDDVFDDALLHISRYVAALSRDAQGCSGCRAQSCAGGQHVDTGCPSGKSINTINAFLKRLEPLAEGVELSVEQWRTLRQAFEVQIEASPFIAYTGAACPAPCQDACTESIPTLGAPNEHRGGKPVGEPVHIKNIEYYLFQIGRRFGWFDGTTTEASQRFAHHDTAMQGFKPTFRQKRRPHPDDKTLIIIGSGPAAMQMAFEALRDGIRVRMYEKSSRPGGLLADGIPAHKFSKRYIEEDFLRLQALGLELHLSSEVVFNAREREYTLKDEPVKTVIASLHNPSQVVALCVGSGAPKKLPAALTQGLTDKQQQSIIQAVDFLQAANHIANELSANPAMSADDREALIAHHFMGMDPRGKHIVVVGGGDTAQDVVRWVARYFTQSHANLSRDLNILVRGTENQHRGVLDGYPSPSKAPSKENKLRDEEVHYIQGDTRYLSEISAITALPDGRLTLRVNQSQFKYANVIKSYPELRQLAHGLPREMRPLDQEKTSQYHIEQVDLVICALGFTDPSKIPIVAGSLVCQSANVMIAGDASNVEANIIVGAQANAQNTWRQNKNNLLATNVVAWGRASHTLFAPQLGSENDDVLPRPLEGLGKG